MSFTSRRPCPDILNLFRKGISNSDPCLAKGLLWQPAGFLLSSGRSLFEVSACQTVGLDKLDFQFQIFFHSSSSLNSVESIQTCRKKKKRADAN